MTCSLVKIDDASITYIQEQLARGRGLARSLGELDLRRGTVQAFIPSEQMSLATEYASGALRGDQEGKVVSALASYLVSSYGVTSDSDDVLLCQFADGAVRPPDDGGHDICGDGETYKTAWLCDAERAEDNGELWYVDRESSFAGMVTMLEKELWFPSVCILTGRTEGKILGHGELITYKTLSDMTRTLRAALIGGWDSMNYLLWTPEGSKLGGKRL
jgi:hypothetical protein